MAELLNRPNLKNRPLINWPAAAAIPLHEPIIQRSENTRPRASKVWPFGTGHPPCHQWCPEPVAPHRALYSQHQRFKFASSQPRTSMDTVDDQTSCDLPDLHPCVVFVRVECRSTSRSKAVHTAGDVSLDVAIGRTRRSALIIVGRPPFGVVELPRSSVAKSRSTMP